LRGNW